MHQHSRTVFVGSQAVATGTHEEVVATLRDLESKGEARSVLVFDDVTGEQIDVDVRASRPASAPEPAPESEPRRPGRPKLGVVAREVTLLPRHWEWLSAQPGGASVALRKLVETARRENAQSDTTRRAQEGAVRFMTAMAGNEPGFEEACRALFAGDRDTFRSQIARWPKDVADYSDRLAAEAFSVAE